MESDTGFCIRRAPTRNGCAFFPHFGKATSSRVDMTESHEKLLLCV